MKNWNAERKRKNRMPKKGGQPVIYRLAVILCLKSESMEFEARKGLKTSVANAESIKVVLILFIK